MIKLIKKISACKKLINEQYKQNRILIETLLMKINIFEIKVKVLIKEIAQCHTNKKTLNLYFIFDTRVTTHH